MMEVNKSYDKYYLKRDQSTGHVVKEKGKPVLGECAKRDCRLEPRHVKILNKSWKKTGLFYSEVKKEIKNDVKSEQRIALESEAKELGIKFRDNIGDEKLEQKINEAKK